MRKPLLLNHWAELAVSLVALAGCVSTVSAEAAEQPVFERRLPLRLDNTGGEARRHWPLSVSVKSLRAEAADFNPDNCSVVAPGGQEIPHQVDEIDPSTGAELCFLADLPADTAVTYHVAYAATGTRRRGFAPKTGTDQEWDPDKANIGWESNLGAYRTYYGQFDFFGKYTYEGDRRPGRLIYPVDRKVSYHKEQGWGIDALHVGSTSGLGGLTLYAGNRAHLVQNPAGKGSVEFAKRVLAAGPVRAAVEVMARNVVPDKPDVAVRAVCLIYAEHQESEIRVSVTGADATTQLAPGLIKLPKEERFIDEPLGCVGNWGSQEEAIGDVGMAVVVPPAQLRVVVDLAAESRLRCDLANGALRYWIIGEWRKGRRSPAASTASTWREEVQALARLLRAELPVAVGAPK